MGKRLGKYSVRWGIKKVLKYFRYDVMGRRLRRNKLGIKLRKMFSRINFGRYFKNKRNSLSVAPFNRVNFKTILVNRKKMRYYYGGMKKYKYKALLRKADSLKGESTANFISLLELQFFVVVFRLNLAKTFAEAKVRIKCGFFAVNREIIKNPYRPIKEGSIIEVNVNFQRVISKEVRSRLLRGDFLIACPKYFEFDFTTITGVILYRPHLSEVPFPFYINSSYFIGEFLYRFR